MISHSHKTIFIHIPKCGGQSIETCFLDDLGLSWANRAPLLLRQNNNLETGPPRLAHMIASDYVKFHYASEEMFNQYYSFSILRDPVSRIISMYNYLGLKGRFRRVLSFDAFLFDFISECFKNNGSRFWFIRPQQDFISNLDGEILVNDIFRLEDIETAFPLIKKKSNLCSELRHVNSSKKMLKRENLTKDHISFIKEYYSGDFEILKSMSRLNSL